jgi:hypothetical protein
MFAFSDAWFLTSLLVTSDWSSMKDILAVGDALNHAIFTQDEIDNALKKLIPLGYMETNNKLYRATLKAHELTNCSAYKRAGMFSQIDVILKRLNKTCGK